MFGVQPMHNWFTVTFALLSMVIGFMLILFTGESTEEQPSFMEKSSLYLMLLCNVVFLWSELKRNIMFADAFLLFTPSTIVFLMSDRVVDASDHYETGMKNLNVCVYLVNLAVHAELWYSCFNKYYALAI